MDTDRSNLFLYQVEIDSNTILWASPELQTQLGFDPAGEPISEKLVAAEDVPVIHEAQHKIKTTGEAQPLQYRLRSQELLIPVNSRNYPAEPDNPTEIIGYAWPTGCDLAFSSHLRGRWLAAQDSDVADYLINYASVTPDTADRKLWLRFDNGYFRDLAESFRPQFVMPESLSTYQVEIIVEPDKHPTSPASRAAS